MRRRIRFAFLVLFLAIAQNLAGAEYTLQGEVVNPSPLKKEVECFHSESLPVKLEFLIYFPAGNDRYQPVNFELANLISLEPPMVTAPDGVRVEGQELTCVPEMLEIPKGGSVVRVMGGRATYKALIRVDETVSTGPAGVTLRFHTIDLIREMIPSTGAKLRTTAELNLTIWTSKAAREELLRLQAEEKKSTAARHAQQRKEMLILGGGILGAFLLILLIGFGIRAAFRPWLAPDLRVTIQPGAHVQHRNVLTLANSGRKIEPGTVLETLWATDRHGKRHRIKVETFAAGDSEIRVNQEKLDVLVSVGKSVGRGKYLAQSGGGNVLISVKR